MNTPPEFQPFPKLARLSREMVITEKLDGTNAQVLVTDAGDIFAASRTRWITPQNDNYGFARWVEGNKAELLKLGPGQHFGEWWGAGIQRTYGLKEKRFSLFNSHRWHPVSLGSHEIPGVKDVVVKDGIIVSSGPGPACCHVVPKIMIGEFSQSGWELCMKLLTEHGSFAAPGFMNPEGIVIYHTAAKVMFKKTFNSDATGKGEQ